MPSGIFQPFPHIIQASCIHPAQAPACDDAASYITENYSKDLSLETVAAQFYVNKCYLSRIFKEATGFTVNEYINMARVRRARELLSATSMSITEVSCLLGYDSITYFERVFHRYTQTSPMKYRKAYTPSMWTMLFKKSF